MAVITISRELGSGGDQIADLLCEKRGYCRLDKDLLSHIAEEAGVDVKAVLAKERAFARRPRLVSQDMTSLYRKDPSAFGKRADMDDQTYANVVRETMEKFAREGNTVIIGRGGQMVLRDWPTGLHVHLYAPEAVRVERLTERLNISAAEARRRIAASDERKRHYIRLMHNNASWKNPKYYHLSIDTGRVPPQAAAELILLAAQRIDEAQA